MGARYFALGLLLAGIAVSVAAPLRANATEYYQDHEELGLVRSIAVKIVSDTAGVCPADPAPLKAVAERVVQQAGIAIDDAGLGTEGNFQLGILARNMRHLLDQCIDRLDVQLLRRYTAPPDGHWTIAVAYYHRIMLAATNKIEMQAVLRSAVSDVVADMVNKVITARRERSGTSTCGALRC